MPHGRDGTLIVVVCILSRLPYPSLTKLSLQYQIKGEFCGEILDVKLLV